MDGGDVWAESSKGTEYDVKVRILISPWFVAWAIVIALFNYAAAVGPYVNPRSYEGDVFASVRTVPWAWWSTGWLAAGLIATVAALTRSVKVWIAACVMTLLPSLMWVFFIVYEHYANGSSLTVLGQALWGFVVSGLVLLAFHKHQVVYVVESSSAH